MDRLIIAFAVGIALSGQSALAGDCDAAMDQHSINQCLHDAWLAADADLNQAYASARELLKSIDSDLPVDQQGAVAALKEAQRAWITYRDKACEAEGYMMQGGSAQPMFVSGCLKRLTVERTASLLALATQY